MNIIPTENKEKLPKGFSYPVGAEKLSELLFGVPQFNELTIRFWQRDTFWSSKYKQKIKEQSEITVLTVTYRHPHTHMSSSRHMVESGYYSPTWEIWVYSVPTENVAAVKEQLITEVLPAVKQWLLKVGCITEHVSKEWKSVYGLSGNKVSSTAG